MEKQEFDLITFAQAAEACGVTSNAIANAVRRGSIKKHEIYGLECVSVAEIEAWRQHEVKPKGPMLEEGMLTTSAAAELAGIGRNNIIMAIRNGNLHAIQAGSRWMVKQEDVLAWRAATRPGRKPRKPKREPDTVELTLYLPQSTMDTLNKWAATTKQPAEKLAANIIELACAESVYALEEIAE